MLLKLTRLSILGLFLFSAACQRQEVSGVVHEAPRTETSGDFAAPGTATAGVSATAPAGNVIPAEAKDFLAKWKDLHSINSLENERRNRSADTRKVRFELSTQALKMVRSASEGDSIRTEILNTFAAGILLGCDAKISHCPYSRIFESDPNSAHLTLAIAAQSDASGKPEDLRRAVAMLRLAFSQLNNAPLASLSLEYLKRATPYESLLKASKDPADATRLRSHREIVDMLLTDLAETNRKAKLSDDMIRDLAKGFQVWNFDRTRSQETATRETLVLKLVARDLFEGGRLQETLSNFEKDPRALRGKLQPTVAKRPKVTETLGLNTSMPKDASTFIFEGLWLEKLTLGEAKILWSAYMESKPQSQRETIRLASQSALHAYLKNRMFVTAQSVNKIISDFFSVPGQFATSEAFHEAIKEGTRGQLQWSEAIGKFSTLENFYDQNLRILQPNDKTAKDLTMFFAGVDSNIKMLSTYPTMLVMCYHLARLKFGLKVWTWGGQITIDAGKILEWFFSGELSPWFPYGDDKKPISRSEIALVYHYAIEMGVLQDGGVNLDSLFQMMTEQMLGKLREEVQQIHRVYRSRFETSPVAVEFRQICEEQRERTKLGNATFASTRTPIAHLVNYTVMGYPQGGAGNLMLDQTFQRAWTFYETEDEVTRYRLDDNLETIRIELSPKIAMLDMYLDLTRAHMKRHDVKGGAAILAEIEARIAPLKELRKDVYSLMFRLHKNLSACGEGLMRAEDAGIAHSINGLKAHFRQVHADMKALRASGAAANAINHKYGFAARPMVSGQRIQGLEAHERALGFTTEHYRVSRLQIFLRIADILQSGYQDGSKKVAAIRDANSIIMSNRIEDFDLAWRENDLMIEWQDKEEDFVRLAIQNVFDVKRKLVEWADATHKANGFQIRIPGLAALVKAGPQETDDGVQQLTVADLMRSTLHMLKHIDVDESMGYVLTATSRFRIPYYDQTFDEFIWTKGNRAWMGIFDSMFASLKADRLGDLVSDNRQSRRAAPRTGPMEDFQKHAASMRSLGDPALTVPMETMHSLNTLYSSQIDTQLDLAVKVIKEAARLEKIRAVKPDVFPSWRMYSNRPAPNVALLSASAVDHFDGEVRELKRGFGYTIPTAFSDAVKAHLAQ